MRLTKKPLDWVSAHRDIEFTFEFDNVFDLQTVLLPSAWGWSGKTAFVFDNTGLVTLNVGNYIYIGSGVYKGYHKVTYISPSANIALTDSEYLGEQITGEVTIIEDKVFTLYAGYTYVTAPLNKLSEKLPYHKVAEFKPEPNAAGKLVVNVSGYVNKLFDVLNSNSNIQIGSMNVFYNLFNHFNLFADGVLVSHHWVINSAITQEELNTKYVDTGRDLNGGNLGNHYLSCGYSEGLQIKGGYVVSAGQYQDGSPTVTALYFDPAGFTSGFKITP